MKEVYSNGEITTFDSDSGLWYLAYLRDQGYDWKSIEKLQRIIVEMLRKDNENKHFEKNDLMNTFTNTMNNIALE